jgi:hypothetical protein
MITRSNSKFRANSSPVMQVAFAMERAFERGCWRDQLAISERINCDMKVHCTPGISEFIGMVLRTRLMETLHP